MMGGHDFFVQNLFVQNVLHMCTYLCNSTILKTSLVKFREIREFPRPISRFDLGKHTIISNFQTFLRKTIGKPYEKLS